MYRNAQAELVSRYLRWDRVAERLSKYPNIQECYTQAEMRAWEDRPPYYCHYLAWRLSGWEDEKLFGLLDGLIGICKTYAGWSKKHRLNDGRFDNFWSDMWELQVAEAVGRKLGEKAVAWLPQGPDLKATIDGEDCFVECYVPKQLYRTELFIKELLQAIDPWFKVEHQSGFPIHLPDGLTEQSFLDAFFRQFLSRRLIDQIRSAAGRGGYCQVQLPRGTGNLQVEFRDPNSLAPPGTNNAQSTCEHVIHGVLSRAIQQKASENRLSEHRPNTVAVNTLLAPDYQFGRAYMNVLGQAPSDLAVSSEEAPVIDAIAVFACGVDERLSLEQGDYWYLRPDEHPFRVLCS